ncbi:hypothetical protein Ct61P_08244 [Colletotrichum tofieldiae]|nr:hypothetical protein Ct61P_08244 [Colletotrichum tofieldiae]
MDPLTITTSAVTLIEATAKITKLIYQFYHALRTADARINDLCDELNHLTEFLKAVNDVLTRCRPGDLAPLDEELWHQSDAALANCEMILEDLTKLITKIKDNSASRRFGWRTKAVIDLSQHGNELAAFRDKIHKSNWALQTILQTINLLDKLKSSIDAARRESCRPAGGFSHARIDSADTRVTRNLQELVNVANRFHSAASSCASTSRGGRSDTAWNPSLAAGMSVSGELSPVGRERVEHFLRRNVEVLSEVGETREIICESPQSTRSMRNPNDMSLEEKDELFDDSESDTELEWDYVVGLQALAVESIKAHEFTKAADVLKQALAGPMTWDLEKAPDDTRPSIRELKIQLATCYFLQGNWRLAEPLVSEMAAVKKNRDLVVCNLLHALSLGYLSEYLFDEASETCQQALLGKKALRKHANTDDDQHDYCETLGLYALIFEMSDDYIRAEVYRRLLRVGFTYQHPKNWTHFLANHRRFLTTVFPKDAINLQQHEDPGSLIPTSSISSRHSSLLSERNLVRRRHRRPKKPLMPLSTLQVRSHQQLRLDADTNKEMVLEIPSIHNTNSSDGVFATDDEHTGNICNAPLVVSLETQSPLRKRALRMFSSMRIQQANEDSESEASHDSLSTGPERGLLVSLWSSRVSRSIFSTKISRRFWRKRSTGLEHRDSRINTWVRGQLTGHTGDTYTTATRMQDNSYGE